MFLAIWFATLFLLRTALHWQRTGATGMHLFSAPAGSPAWWAALAGVIGLAAAVASPLAAIAGVPGRSRRRTSPP